jgi:hypothetical protein
MRLGQWLAVGRAGKWRGNRSCGPVRPTAGREGALAGWALSVLLATIPVGFIAFPAAAIYSRTLHGDPLRCEGRGMPAGQRTWPVAGGVHHFLVWAGRGQGGARRHRD